MAFKMNYSKGGFPFKNDDDEKKVVNNEESENNEFVNDGSKQPGVTQGLHDALTESLEGGGKFVGDDDEPKHSSELHMPPPR